ncbi:TonB-dependent receptor [Solimonas marina]|uniref:TonB-dependent receptor n=1 Tax=Solimonas marina TaxID=2714601 RepID=A0A969W9V9_9GAMM|nr:TonB-dependent receptor [Solimonas marina]NKF22663.1 TonB-dependent receptor [Solimonas marina]
MLIDKRASLWPAIAVATFGVAPPVHAATPSAAAAELPEVVVTAEKRQSTVQQTPIAVTAFDQDDLLSREIGSAADLASYVPDVHFGETFGQPKISIRGISYSNLSTGGEASVAMNVDGIYVSRPAGQLGSLFDVSRVEVLRGPQGTLYGRNATGGAVNVETGRPGDTLDGYARVNYGAYNDVALEGAVGGPIDAGKTVLVRLAGMSETRDGYGKDYSTGEDVDDLDTKGVRGTVVLKPADALTVTTIAEYSRERDHSGGPHFLAEGGQLSDPGALGDTPYGIVYGGQVTYRSRNTYADQQPFYHREGYAYTADVQYDGLAGVKLRSLTGYRKLDWQLTADLDSTSFPFSFITYDEASKQVSQEFNASGSSGALDWTAGLYYFHEKLDGDYRIPVYLSAYDDVGEYSQGYAARGGAQTTAAYAAFGQLDWHLATRFTLTLGLRYSHEKKGEDDYYVDAANETQYADPYDPDHPPYAADAPFYQSKRWAALTPKFGLRYDVDRDTMLYASASEGFKAGLYNLGGTTVAAGAPLDRSNPVVNPEKVWAYEIGLKAMPLHRRLRTNLSAFYYDYRDLQVSQVSNNTTLFTNAAKAKIYGLEFEGDVLIADRWSAYGSASWLHARFASFDSQDTSHPSLGVQDLSGNSLSQAPNVSARLGTKYAMPLAHGTISGRVEGNYTSRIYFSEFNLNSVSQSAYAMLDTYLSYRDDKRWQLMAYVKNLTDRKALNFSYMSSPAQGDPLMGWYLPPRTYGLQLRYDLS